MQDFQRRHRYLEHIKSLAVIYFGLIQELHDVVTTLVRLGDAAVATALPNRTNALQEYHVEKSLGAVGFGMVMSVRRNRCLRRKGREDGHPHQGPCVAY